MERISQNGGRLILFTVFSESVPIPLKRFAFFLEQIHLQKGLDVQENNQEVTKGSSLVINDANQPSVSVCLISLINNKITKHS